MLLNDVMKIWYEYIMIWDLQWAITFVSGQNSKQMGLNME